MSKTALKEESQLDLFCENRAISKKEAKAEILAKIEKHIDIARRELRICIVVPEIDFTLRGACAGQAVFKSTRKKIVATKLRFNLSLAVENWPDYLYRTVPHEVAHLVAATKWGRDKIAPHGPQWEAVMRLFGVSDPSRCHNYDVSSHVRRRPRPHIYACKCQEHRMTTVRHNRMLKKGSVYLCRSCKTILEFVRTEKDSR